MYNVPLHLSTNIMAAQRGCDDKVSDFILKKANLRHNNYIFGIEHGFFDGFLNMYV